MDYLDIISKGDCTGCSACVNSCPVNCISMEPDERGFLYPVVDRDYCLHCGKCETTCPVLNKDRFHIPSQSHFYGCKSSDDSIRRSSSSGGFFYELAKYVIDRGGVVFGARFSEDFKKVYHSVAMTMEEVRPMMVSKYVQSEIGSSYNETKRFLDEGREVLFTGTPCQIAGLNSFLGKDYEGLILAEIVCHGVPSQKVWDLYLSGLEKKFGGKSTFVTFRDKSKSWRQSDFKVEFDNGLSFIQPNSDNPYMKSFLKNLNLRESCTRCKFKRFASGADITMGDFWGSTELDLLSSDDIGISIIAVHKNAGQRAFDSLKLNLKDVVNLDEKSAFVFNSNYSNSARRNEYTTLFYSYLHDNSLDILVDNFSFGPEHSGFSLKNVLSLIKKAVGRLFCFHIGK